MSHLTKFHVPRVHTHECVFPSDDNYRLFLLWLTSLQLFLISLSGNYQTIEPNLEKSMIDDTIFISGIEDH